MTSTASVNFKWIKNPTLWEKATETATFNLHRRKVKTAKPAIDCDPPQPRPHVHIKRKKLLSEESRQLAIIKENLRLLNITARIAAGLQTGPPLIKDMFRAGALTTSGEPSKNDCRSRSTSTSPSTSESSAFLSGFRLFPKKRNGVKPTVAYT